MAYNITTTDMLVKVYDFAGYSRAENAEVGVGLPYMWVVNPATHWDLVHVHHIKSWCFSCCCFCCCCNH